MRFFLSVIGRFPEKHFRHVSGFITLELASFLLFFFFIYYYNHNLHIYHRTIVTYYYILLHILYYHIIIDTYLSSYIPSLSSSFSYSIVRREWLFSRKVRSARKSQSARSGPTMKMVGRKEGGGSCGRVSRRPRIPSVNLFRNVTFLRASCSLISLG